MIAYLKGEVAEITEDSLFIEVNNIGYQVFISAKTAERLPLPGKQVKIHTYFHVKEDLMQLFGFLNKDELELYKLLLTVNGIGPKAGLSILSALSVNELRLAVLSDDVKAISKAQGIGRKTAQKLILELRDKLDLHVAFEDPLDEIGAVSSAGIKDIRGEAVEALTALGYSGTDALKAVKKVECAEDMSVEEILKASLKFLSFL